MTSHPETCPSCDSHKMIPGAEFPDSFDFAMSRAAVLRVAARPKAAVFRQKVESPLEADVCGECGYVQFYVTRPDRLWTAYQRARGEGTGS